MSNIHPISTLLAFGMGELAQCWFRSDSEYNRVILWKGQIHPTRGISVRPGCCGNLPTGVGKIALCNSCIRAFR